MEVYELSDEGGEGLEKGLICISMDGVTVDA